MYSTSTWYDFGPYKQEFWQILFLTITFKKNVCSICNCIPYHECIPIRREILTRHQWELNPPFSILYVCWLEHFSPTDLLLASRFQTMFLLQDPHPSCASCHRTCLYCDMTSGPTLWCHEAHWAGIMNGRSVPGNHFIAKKASNILTIYGRDCELHKYVPLNTN